MRCVVKLRIGRRQALQEFGLQREMLDADLGQLGRLGRLFIEQFELHQRQQDLPLRSRPIQQRTQPADRLAVLLLVGLQPGQHQRGPYLAGLLGQRVPGRALGEIRVARFQQGPGVRPADGRIARFGLEFFLELLDGFCWPRFQFGKAGHLSLKERDTPFRTRPAPRRRLF